MNSLNDTTRAAFRSSFACLRPCARTFRLPLSQCLPYLRGALLICLLVIFASQACALDYVTFRRDKKTIDVSGRMLVEAQDGGWLVLARDGVLWAIQPGEQVNHRRDETPFQFYNREELSKRLLAELPPGFRVHSTTHYLIFNNTSPAYAQWCGSLFERLYMAFTNFWTRRGFKLRQPDYPLVAILFADKQSYLDFSRPELGDAGESILGYFGLTSNRMTMYDLTGLESQGRGARRNRTTAQINQILAQPDAQQTVATIVHEATHQIAFNCGLQARLSDCPLWFSEGIAMYFETPDLRSPKGWGGLGAVNRPRLERFRDCAAEWSTDSLAALIRDDREFRDPKRALDAYAASWALTYFLLQRHSKEYIAYLTMLSSKEPLIQDGPKGRLDQFRQAFGDLKALNVEFLRYMSSVR